MSSGGIAALSYVDGASLWRQFWGQDGCDREQMAKAAEMGKSHKEKSQQRGSSFLLNLWGGDKRTMRSKRTPWLVADGLQSQPSPPTFEPESPSVFTALFVGLRYFSCLFLLL